MKDRKPNGPCEEYWPNRALAYSGSLIRVDGKYYHPEQEGKEITKEERLEFQRESLNHKTYKLCDL